MQELLASVIPLNLSTVLLSPLVFALMLTVLGGKNYNLRRGAALLLGMVIVGAGVILLGIILGQKIELSSQPKLSTTIIDLLAGLFFLGVAIKFFLDKNYQIKTEGQENSSDFLKWFGISFILEITNFGALIICFNTAGYVAVSDVDVFIKIALWVFNLFCFSLPALFPLLFYISFPNISRKILLKLNYFILKNIRKIVIIIFGLFGLVFLSKGFAFFI